MPKAYLSLGSNLGDKMLHLEKAVQLLKEHQAINVSKCSSFYETAPVGYLNQDYFLNIVVEVETTLSPYSLLEYCQSIEQSLKRKRIKRWGPRTIDVDILLYENYNSNDELLTIPHPRMLERAFVMIPLFEIAPDLMINNQDIESIVNKLKNELNSDEIKIISDEQIMVR